MAAIALVSLKYFEQDNEFRCQVCRWYGELLGNESGIGHISIAPGCVSSRRLYKIFIDKRDEVIYKGVS
jgi:dTDP-4-amino-4,6-dideoxygalactose transaminase